MKKKAETPNSIIRSGLRKIWLRSRERNAALKRDKYSCVKCGLKQSKRKGAEVKVQVDHIDGIAWGDLIQQVRERLLQTPDKLQTLCEKHHLRKQCDLCEFGGEQCDDRKRIVKGKCKGFLAIVHLRGRE